MNEPSTPTVQMNHFDRSKPFYPLVMNFVAAVHGWNNLFGRGVGRLVAASAEDTSSIDAYVASIAAPAEIASAQALRDLARLPGGIGGLELANRTQKNLIAIDPDEIADELIREHAYLVPQLVRASEQLVIVAWETTRKHHTHDPLWEYLRHCRNAAAHGGRFHFLNNGPKRPAKFGRFRITPGLQGKPLFGPSRPKRGSYLRIGDALSLLWHIEQAFPSMTA